MPLDEIPKATGCGYQDITAPLELAQLFTNGCTTICYHRGHASFICKLSALLHMHNSL